MPLNVLGALGLTLIATKVAEEGDWELVSRWGGFSQDPRIPPTKGAFCGWCILRMVVSPRSWLELWPSAEGRSFPFHQ